ncbi:MAG: hypothetical protein LUF30_07595 [Lachnospiraceae bacterium]|nr:hypothetical protein [Lachnospiraceae bacterium]
MRNSDSGSYIYFTLPVDAEEMEGRDVYILFTLLGKEIYTIPEFVLSSTSSGDSVLTVDGTQSDLNLVFVAYYTVQTEWISVLTSVIFRMLLWILAGSLLFGWMYVSMEASPHAGAVVQQSEACLHAGAVVQQQSEQCPHAGSGGQQQSEPCLRAGVVEQQQSGEK